MRIIRLVVTIFLTLLVVPPLAAETVGQLEKTAPSRSVKKEVSKPPIKAEAIGQLKKTTPARSVKKEVSEAPIRIEGKIISISEKPSFVVINLGINEGIDTGVVLDVYQGDEKVATLGVARVRNSVAAAEIVEIEPTTVLKIGDRVILPEMSSGSILKEIEKRKAKKAKERLAKRQKAEKARERLIKKRKAKKAKRREGLLKTLRSKISAIKGVPYSGGKALVAAEIKSGSGKVWFYLIQTLRDYGFIIVNSNKATGLLTARKGLELAMAKAIWADIRAYTDYEAVLQAEVISKGKGSIYLKLKLDGSYRLRGKYRQFHIRQGDIVYWELEEIAAKIKSEAER